MYRFRTLVELGTATVAALALASCSVSGEPAGTPDSVDGATRNSTATSEPARTIGDGEPWILYQALFAATDLGLIRPDGSDALQIPGGPGNRWHPDWSPDGLWITFEYITPTKGEIWISRPDGSEGRILVPCEGPCDGDPGSDFGVGGPAWTADGTAVGFDGAEGASTDYPDGVCYVGITEIASGEIRRMAELPGCKGGGTDGLLGDLYFLHFNPGATEYVVQGVSTDGRTALFIGPTAGGELRQLTEWGLGGRPDWSPDGEWIVFMSGDSYDEDTPITLHRIRPDGSGLEQLTTPEGPSIDVYPRYLWDGSGILYSRCPRSNAPACEARRMSVDGSTDELLFTPPGGNPVHVIWRPGTPTK